MIGGFEIGTLVTLNEELVHENDVGFRQGVYWLDAKALDDAATFEDKHLTRPTRHAIDAIREGVAWHVQIRSRAELAVLIRIQSLTEQGLRVMIGRYRPPGLQAQPWPDARARWWPEGDGLNDLSDEEQRYEQRDADRHEVFHRPS